MSAEQCALEAIYREHTENGFLFCVDEMSFDEFCKHYATLGNTKSKTHVSVTVLYKHGREYKEFSACFAMKKEDYELFERINPNVSIVFWHLEGRGGVTEVRGSLSLSTPRTTSKAYMNTGTNGFPFLANWISCASSLHDG